MYLDGGGWVGGTGGPMGLGAGGWLGGTGSWLGGWHCPFPVSGTPGPGSTTGPVLGPSGVGSFMSQ